VNVEAVDSIALLFSPLQRHAMCPALPLVFPAGIQDIDELVAAFNAAEDANYTLFNYVNEVNTEVEALEDNIGRVRQEIDAYVAQVGCRTTAGGAVSLIGVHHVTTTVQGVAILPASASGPEQNHNRTGSTEQHSLHTRH
jgi:hypothetical protein